MTTGTLKTKGTRLYFTFHGGASSSDSDGVVILYVNCATGVQGLGGAADQIDKTCLDSEEREYEAGFPNPGQVTVPFNFIPTSGAHQALEAMQQSGATEDWMAVLSDAVLAGDIPNSIDSNGHLVSEGPTTVRFQGYVADFNIDIQTNEIVRGTLVVQRSGAREFDWPDATQ